MNKIPRWLLAAAVAVLIVSLAATSFAQGSAAGSGQVSARQQDTLNVRASQLIGKDVRNSQGQDLGEIQDLFVDLPARQVHYAVLSFGGFLGLGDKLFAYPMRAFTLSRDRGELVLDVSRERLEKAPGFASEIWPNYGDDPYFGEVRRYFNEAQRPPATARGMMRATELLGRGVNDRSGRDAGEIQDVVVDLAQGRISYLVMDFDKRWSLDDKLLPLPVGAFSLPRERGEELVLNLDRSRLDMSRGFESNKWPDLNSSAFRQHTEAYFLALERPMPRQGGGADGTRSSGASR